MSKQILFITETAELGGGEINLLLIVRNLLQSGFCPLVIVPKKGPLTDALDQCAIEYICVPLGRTYSTSIFLGKRYKLPNFLALAIMLGVGIRWSIHLRRMLQHLQPDLVHTMSLWAHIFGGLATCCLHVPLLWHMQQIIAPMAGWGLYRRAFVMLAQRLPDHILAISDPVARQFEPHLAKHITLLPNAIDAHWFNGSAAVPQTRNTMNTTPLRIGSAARLTPWKGHTIHLQVAAHLHQRGFAFCWQIAGTEVLGEHGYRDYLQREIECLGLQQHVSLCGWVAEMQSFYQQLDVFVHLPTQPEPFGLTLAEAMACGLPIITTAGGGMSAQVAAAGGTVVAPQAIEPVVDQLVHWKRDAQSRLHVGSTARSYAYVHFRPAAYRQALIDVYKSMVT